MIPTQMRGVAMTALTLFLSLSAFSQTHYLHAPAINEYARHDPKGITILPDGRLLQPTGRHLPLARWPHGMAISPDGETVFVASEGVGQLIKNLTGEAPVITHLDPIDSVRSKRHVNGGAAVFSLDGKTLYWSSGETGGVYLFDVTAGNKSSEISLNVDFNGRKFADSYVMDVKLSADGRYLYCADVTNFRLGVIDTFEKRLVGSVDVGRYPYALAVVDKRVYVANIGMFNYSPIPASLDSKYDKRGLTFPPFGFPSAESEKGVHFEGRDIPGLGVPNVPESFSVWGVDVSIAASPQVVNKIKTGLLVGAISDKGKTIGGSAPNFLAVSGTTLYVSNGNNDSIERVDIASNKITGITRIIPSPLTAKLRGVSPAGMVVSPDGKRIYIAESGINAIAVLNTSTSKIIGHIPTAWYPYRLALSKGGGKLLCICFRGFGNGPKGGKAVPDSPFLGMQGSLSVQSIPSNSELKPLTEQVLKNNGLVDASNQRNALSSPVIPTVPGKSSEQIKYVVFITKENHSYDAIFDRIPGANDDSSLLRWGLHQTISAPGQPTLADAAVMTNHNALARQFTVSDNFYMQPEASGVGHRWLVGVQPNNFCQMLYTLGWSFSAHSSAPGRRVSFGSNGSLAPEDYPEAGSMWEHLNRNGISFRNYGEGFEFAGVDEGEGNFKTGAKEVVNIPMSKVLYDNTCRDFPIFNMNIPDQYRAYWFEQDFTKLFLNPLIRSVVKKKTLRNTSSLPLGVKEGITPANSRMRGGTQSSKTAPQFINICICNDHGTDPNPKKGYPYKASWMADNDLALGRIVEFLSHTPYWKNMAIFVTQDDAGGESDHIDAQRSVMLVISPWAKRAYVSHRHTTIVSMHRTLYQIMGLPPLNMFDALANDLSDCFTIHPDFHPYSLVDVDRRIFDPEKAKDPTDPEYKKARQTISIARDDPDEIEE